MSIIVSFAGWKKLRKNLKKEVVANCNKKFIMAESIAPEDYVWYQWCKQDWDLPELSLEASALLKQCADLPETTPPDDDIEDLIEKSNEFPIPFPIETVRLVELKKRKPLDVLKKNIASTYPVVHERVLRLMAIFLIYKREHGSYIEKELYKNMTVPELIDRMLQKRAICFLSRHDVWMLITGKEGSWCMEDIVTSE